MYKKGGKPTSKPAKVNYDPDAFEARIGIRFEEQMETKIGYLGNFKTSSYTDQNGNDMSALLCYFIQENGEWFKGLFPFKPYFYLLCGDEVVKEVMLYLTKTFEQVITNLSVIEKEDLELVNHLSGKTSKFIKLDFKNVSDLMQVRKELMPIVEANKKNRETQEAYAGFFNAENAGESRENFLAKIYDLREFDVSYHVRVNIDSEVRCGLWYDVELDGNLITGIQLKKEKLEKAPLRVCAFDIETTKAPLKFPDSKFDEIMMISYMIDGKGFLITNRKVVGEDVEDFEYSPKPEYEGVFKVFNEEDERQLLERWFSHMRETRPFIYVSFNGDFFDWPFIDDRTKLYGMKLEEELGIFMHGNDEYRGRFATHMDCLYWVKRDAYLPQGSHGLKMVTKAKLGYNPVELDPELMVPYAKDKPQALAEYSVSDAVATYYLYARMIHDFIFALCTIIPSFPDEVLRKGSGTLCEELLMAQAFRGNIIFPNKQKEKFENFYQGHLIESETYIGGHVECLKTGVYRADIPVRFRLDIQAYQDLIGRVEQILDFALKVEMNVDKAQVTNYNEIRDQIIVQLRDLKNKGPVVDAEPLIYHVDVAAMYPNIILSNRLQPVAIVNEQVCAGCVYNKPENNCKRNLEWQWKGEYFPINQSEFEMIKGMVEQEEIREAQNGKKDELPFNERVKKAVKQYSRSNYRMVHKSKVELRTDTVCMRENPFYVDTVRDFRDRRYEYKRLTKVWTNKMKDAKEEGDLLKAEDAKNMMNLYESLQLAHKIILNSFYGYVMRKGARWYSMEMAAMVTHTGGNIIMDSRELYDKIGMPLELDTDGIWTLLPMGFPESFTFELVTGKKAPFSFICTMSNVLIYDKYCNPQYQTIKKDQVGLLSKRYNEYETRSEMTVFFEIDGPYKCMLIPAAKEEGKMLKKRYAVFEFSGKMSELKGFELKRRGELNIIKIFQQEVFPSFLEGKTLQEVYDAAGEVASRWYDILESEGEYIDDSELIDYIVEERILGKSLKEYGEQKSTAITCARRIAEFLGQEMVKSKGLVVKFIVAKKPHGAKVTERSIPTAIFEVEDSIKKQYLKRWLKDAGQQDFDMRSIIDWEYYKERLAGTILKIVSIPAALQKLRNPVPSVPYPEWLQKIVKSNADKFKQKDMGFFFQKSVPKALGEIEEIAAKAQKVEMVKPPQTPKAPELHEQMNDCPNPEENFNHWLKYQKSNWRNIRKQTKQGKSVQESQSKKMTTLGKFMHSLDSAVLQYTWHVIQIQPMQESGMLRVWVMTQPGQMFAIKLKVNRTIYINSKVPNQDDEFKKVTKTLPRARQVYHLYEWEKNEELFQQKFESIKNHYLSAPQIEGVYESQVPLDFKAILEIGCMVKPNQKLIPKTEQALGRIYSLRELTGLSSADQEANYMPKEVYDKVLFFHLNSAHSNTNLFALAFESQKSIQFFGCSPKQQKQAMMNTNHKAAFNQVLTENGQELQFSDWQVLESFFSTEHKDTFKAIEKKLQEYRQKHKGAAVLVLYSPLDAERYGCNGMPTLSNEFPVIRRKMLDFTPRSALEWQKEAAKHISERIIESASWLRQQIDMARYSHVPVGNLGEDPAINAMDLLYSKSLQVQNSLLWYSPTSLPDIGGHESRDFRSYYSEELETPTINEKGFYRGITVELKIGLIFLNTILKASMEIEEGLHSAVYGLKKGKQKEQSEIFDADLDEYVSCGEAFKVLRGLVQKWVKDIMYDNAVADMLGSQVQRWLSSPSSKLYDPMLHSLVHKMMKKSFLQLVSSFKQLGCKVVFANFSKIILYTGKYELEEAQNFVEFAIQTVKQQPKFEALFIESVQFWEILLWKDNFNFSGVSALTAEKQVAQVWDIARYLPPAPERKFRILAADLVQKVYDEQVRRLNAELSGVSGPHKSKEEPKFTSYMDSFLDEKLQPDHQFIANLMTEHFQFALLRMVEEVDRKLDYEDEFTGHYEDERYADGLALVENRSDDEEMGNVIDNDESQDPYEAERRRRRLAQKKEREAQFAFPQVFNCVEKYSDPALEFVKFVIEHIFALDSDFYKEKDALRKNLLGKLELKEFAPETREGLDPALLLVVADVVCQECHTSNDIDLCRDPNLNALFDEEESKELIREEDRWICHFCEARLDHRDIEKRLVGMLNRKVVNYQMQDLKCKKCKMVKNHLVGDTCHCTGQYQQTLGNKQPCELKNPNMLNSQADLSLFVRLLRNFANIHEMPVLKEIAEGVLELC